MINSCQAITQINAAAKQSVLLPQYSQHLTGLLYFRSGSGELTGPGCPPLPIGTGAAAVYAAWRPCRLDIREDAFLLLWAFPCSPAEPTPALLADVPPLRPQLDALMGTMEQALGAVQEAALPALLSNQPAREKAHVPPCVLSARKIIETCYHEDLTLEELSTRVGRSKYHLSRIFREYCHISPGAYLTSVRLARAGELLVSTSLPVREIGRQVGFPNSAYFTALFRKRFGCPPGEYRIRRGTN